MPSDSDSPSRTGEVKQDHTRGIAVANTGSIGGNLTIDNSRRTKVRIGALLITTLLFGSAATVITYQLAVNHTVSTAGTATPATGKATPRPSGKRSAYSNGKTVEYLFEQNSRDPLFGVLREGRAQLTVRLGSHADEDDGCDLLARPDEEVHTETLVVPFDVTVQDRTTLPRTDRPHDGSFSPYIRITLRGDTPDISPGLTYSRDDLCTNDDPQYNPPLDTRDLAANSVTTERYVAYVNLSMSEKPGLVFTFFELETGLSSFDIPL